MESVFFRPLAEVPGRRSHSLAQYSPDAFPFAYQVHQRDKRIVITEDHLTFCFRQEIGTTPIKYLQRYRINQSKRLLLETQQTITEVALTVGFSDSGYFSRIFRRETGLTPEAYRQT